MLVQGLPILRSHFRIPLNWICAENRHSGNSLIPVIHYGFTHVNAGAPPVEPLTEIFAIVPVFHSASLCSIRSKQ